jgi:cytoskeletal protein RodZ
MNINRDNYESWFLDYHEGRLDESAKAEVMAFLQENTELEEEFYSFENFSLGDEAEVTESYPDKSELRKADTISADTVQQWLIAGMEGDLTEEQQNRLAQFLQEHPSYMHDRELFLKTRLEADPTEVFENKAGLRRVKVIPMFSTGHVLRYAAIVLLLLGVWQVIRVISPGEEKTQFAQQTDSSATSVVIPVEKTETVQKPMMAQEQKKKDPAEVNTNSAGELQHENRKTESGPLIAASILKPMPLRSLQSAGSTISIEPLYDTKDDIASAGLPAAPDYIEGDSLNILNLDALRDEILTASVDGLNSDAGSDEINSTTPSTRLPFFSRVVRFTAKSVEKISNNRVKVRTVFNPVTGNLAAYEVETERKSWQRQF